MPADSTTPSATPTPGQAGVVTAFGYRRILGRHGDRTAKFGAGGKTLYQAQQRQQDRRRNTDAGIGRQEADQRRAQAHHQQGHYQHILAADAITDMAKHKAAERTHHKTQGIGTEGGQGAHHRIELGKNSTLNTIAAAVP